MITAVNNNQQLTWMQACELACEEHLNVITTRTVMTWYRELHMGLPDSCLKFRRHQQGKNSTAAISPFSEDESLMIRFKSWARSDLAHLSVEKATSFINDNLLNDWRGDDFKEKNIHYPVSPYVVSRWMREAGFMYSGYKKCYYNDRHT